MLGAGLLLWVALLAPRPASAQVIDPDFDDPTFNANIQGQVLALAIQADGKILVGGTFVVPKIALARLTPTGSVDSSFDPPVFVGAAVNAIAIQSDGKILVAYDTLSGDDWLVRLDQDGDRDMAFTPPDLATGVANTIVVQPDGKILVGGSVYYDPGPDERRYLFRLEDDGTLDSGFNPLNPFGRVLDIALEADGQVLIGGEFINFAGKLPRNRVARLDADGDIDNGFNPDPNNTVNAVAVRPDGKIVIGGTFTQVGGAQRTNMALLSSAGVVEGSFTPNPPNAVNALAVQADGKTLVGGDLFAMSSGAVTARTLARLLPNGQLDTAFLPFKVNSDTLRDIVVQPDGKIVVGGAISGGIGGVARVLPQAFDPADSDSDGLPTTWETQFGLSPGSSTGDDGAAGDPDGDGRTNAQELSDGTHPRGFFQRYLAEGVQNDFFSPRLSLLNPENATAHVQLRHLRDDGTVASQVVALAPVSSAGVALASVLGPAATAFSTVIEADESVVVDRTMTWGATGYGSHAESGIAAPAPKWYLAEGSTAGPFSLFYLIQNPSLTQPSNVRVTFLLPSGPPRVENYQVDPNSRFTLWVDEHIPPEPGKPDVRATDVSAIIETTNNVPIIVERAMYLSTPTQLFAAGHGSAGVTAPATSWFLAEGATGPYFDTFVLLANPNPTPATVRATFLLPDGTTLTKDYTVHGTSRFNIWVDEETFPHLGLGKALANTAVSTTLVSLNGVPFIAERAMWWPGPTSASWLEAQNSPGATATDTNWAFAGGEVGGPAATETYILLANTSATVAQVQVKLVFESDAANPVPPVAAMFAVPAQSRFNVPVMQDFPDAVGRRFGAIVDSLGPTPAQLVVERAMYSNAGGVTWAAGTNALATAR